MSDPRIRVSVSKKSPINIKVRSGGSGSIAPGGVTSYPELTDKPSIEGHELVGDSTIEQIGVGTLSVTEIEKILYLG